MHSGFFTEASSDARSPLAATFFVFEDMLLLHSQLHIRSHLLCPFVMILLCEYVNVADCKAIV